MPRFDYDLFDFPSISGGDPDAQTDMMAGLDALFVSSSTKNAEAVGQFLSGFSERFAQDVIAAIVDDPRVAEIYLGKGHVD